jgi:hypothetical protein
MAAHTPVCFSLPRKKGLTHAESGWIGSNVLLRLPGKSTEDIPPEFTWAQ